MKKIFLLSTLLLFIASCNQSKIDSLNNHIQQLQKDSIDYTSMNNALQAKADSMKSQLKILDSIKFAEKICNYGSILIHLNESMKSYFNNRITYSQALEQYTIAKSEFPKIESSINSKLQEEIHKSLTDYQKGLSTIQENEFSEVTNRYLSFNLWIELYKLSNERIKKDLCKISK